MLRNELRPAIRTKRRGRLSQGDVLFDENARPRTAHLTNNTFQKMNWEILEHTAHSPNLAPSDFHLFGPIKNALRSRQFAGVDDVKEAANDWLRNQTNKNFQWNQEAYRSLG
jgi:histone-lysine N-methyltransferase SETMAR